MIWGAGETFWLFWVKLLNHSLSLVKLSNSDEVRGLPKHRQSTELEIYKKLKLLRSPSKTLFECEGTPNFDSTHKSWRMQSKVPSNPNPVFGLHCLSLTHHMYDVIETLHCIDVESGLDSDTDIVFYLDVDFGLNVVSRLQRLKSSSSF